MALNIISYFVIGLLLALRAFNNCRFLLEKKTDNSIKFAPLITLIVYFLVGITIYYLTDLVLNIPSEIGLHRYGNWVCGSIFLVLAINFFTYHRDDKKLYLINWLIVLISIMQCSVVVLFIAIGYGFYGTYNIIIASLIFSIMGALGSLLALLPWGNVVEKAIKKVNQNIIGGLLLLIISILTYISLF